MSNQLSANILYEMLHEPALNDNVVRMYEIGHVLCHESGFAVYEGTDGFQVSELLLPENIDRWGSSVDSPDLQRASTSIDLAPLVRKHADFDSLTADEVDAMDYFELGLLAKEAEAKTSHELSEKARLAISRIDSDMGLDVKEKKVLIEAVKEKDRKKSSGSSERNVREDILLLAHNHPRMPHDTGIHADSLLIPSPADLMAHDYVKKSNAPLVDMIIASTGNVFKAIIYSSEPGQTNPQRYEVQWSRNMIQARVLELLARSGYVATSFELDKNGVPKRGVKSQLNSFVKRQAALSTTS